jgi:hypothetical protein
MHAAPAEEHSVPAANLESQGGFLNFVRNLKFGLWLGLGLELGLNSKFRKPP